MKLLDSGLFDLINKCLFFVQSKLDNIRQNSFILSNFDIFIFLSAASVYAASACAETGIIGAIAAVFVLLTVLKTLITKGLKIELEACNFYFIVYLLICFMSNFTSSLPVQSFYGFSKTLLFAAFYFAMCTFLKNSKNYILPVFSVIGLLIACESIIGIIQNHSGVLSLASWQDTSYVNPEHIISRAYGTLKPYNPNLFGGWLVSGIFSIAALSAVCFVKKKMLPALLCAAAFLTGILCIFYTGCRGAYAAIIIMLLCLLAAMIKLNKKCSLAALGALFSGFAFIVLNKSILHRLMSIFMLRGDSSSSFRMNVYHSVIQMVKDNPIWGIGAGNKVFREIYGLYMLSGFDALSAYCVFLEIAVESGIFALLAFLLFLGSLLKAGVEKIVSAGDKIEKIILFTAAVSIIGVMIHGAVDTVFFRPQVQFVFWTMAAAITALFGKDQETWQQAQ